MHDHATYGRPLISTIITYRDIMKRQTCSAIYVHTLEKCLTGLKNFSRLKIHLCLILLRPTMQNIYIYIFFFNLKTAHLIDMYTFKI